jgi:hypothetical protein
MGIDAIGLGEDFVRAIETTIANCDLLIAIIGANWQNLKIVVECVGSTIPRISCAWKSEPPSGATFV